LGPLHSGRTGLDPRRYSHLVDIKFLFRNFRHKTMNHEMLLEKLLQIRDAMEAGNQFLAWELVNELATLLNRRADS